MSGLTRVEREALWSAWLAGDVSKGLGWLTPAVEKIIAAREQAARVEQAKAIAQAIQAAKPPHVTRDYTPVDAAYDVAASIARHSVEGGER